MHVLVTGNITVAGADNNTKVAFENCAPFRKCRTDIIETFIDEAEHINVAMPMYNLIEKSKPYYKQKWCKNNCTTTIFE